MSCRTCRVALAVNAPHRTPANRVRSRLNCRYSGTTNGSHHSEIQCASSTTKNPTGTRASHSNVDSAAKRSGANTPADTRPHKPAPSLAAAPPNPKNYSAPPPESPSAPVATPGPASAQSKATPPPPSSPRPPPATDSKATSPPVGMTAQVSCPPSKLRITFSCWTKRVIPPITPQRSEQIPSARNMSGSNFR